MKQNVDDWASCTAGLGCRPQLKRVTGTALLSLVMACAGVNAQTAPPASPVSAPNSTRVELLDALRRIDAQLSALTRDARPEDSERLLELKAQFEVLILQAELESLRRENASLQAQRNQARSSGTDQVSGGAQSGAPLETEMSQMRRQFGRLAEQQENVTAQLSTIESQHALLLEELASATSDAPPTPSSPQVQGPEEAELTDLRNRFSQLDTRQGAINEQLKTIADQHAELLDQLGATGDTSDNTAGDATVNTSQNAAPSSATPQIYVVQPGDSLSEISKMFYGTGARWPELLTANPTLQDPDQLFSGTVLTIP